MTILNNCGKISQTYRIDYTTSAASTADSNDVFAASADAVKRVVASVLADTQAADVSDVAVHCVEARSTATLASIAAFSAFLAFSNPFAAAVDAADIAPPTIAVIEGEVAVTAACAATVDATASASATFAASICGFPVANSGLAAAMADAIAFCAAPIAAALVSIAAFIPSLIASPAEFAAFVAAVVAAVVTLLIALFAAPFALFNALDAAVDAAVDAEVNNADAVAVICPKKNAMRNMTIPNNINFILLVLTTVVVTYMPNWPNVSVRIITIKINTSVTPTMVAMEDENANETVPGVPGAATVAVISFCRSPSTVVNNAPVLGSTINCPFCTCVSGSRGTHLYASVVSFVGGASGTTALKIPAVDRIFRPKSSCELIV